jgi:urease accessory protein
MSVNQFGSISKLYLTVKHTTINDNLPPDSVRPVSTVISDCFFTAPFKVMKPFPRADGGITVYQQTASAGIMAGDTQDHRFTVGESATLELVSQSFEKIFKMDHGEKAERQIYADIARNATLLFTPLPCIPFGGGDFSSHTIINLADDSSRLLYEDCICCGRKAYGEEFEYRRYHNTVEIKRAGHLVYRDNTVFEGSDCGTYPERSQFLKSDAMYGPYSHLGTVVLCGWKKSSAEVSALLKLPEKLLYTSSSYIQIADTNFDTNESFHRVEAITDNSLPLLAGVTETGAGDIIVRVLGTSAEEVQYFTDGLKKIV